MPLKYACIFVLKKSRLLKVNFELLTFLRREMIKLSIHMTCFQDESINEYASFVSKGGGYKHTDCETFTRRPPMSGTILPTMCQILVVIH